MAESVVRLAARKAHHWLSNKDNRITRELAQGREQWMAMMKA
jgi:hypothetical protein